jgi:hypothetical protein
LFTDFYATGTRTDRGLEAITLSVPPTPGRSIVKRPDNADYYSLGKVFQDRGYDVSFLYGGIGFFDNKNVFFPATVTILSIRRISKMMRRHSKTPGACATKICTARRFRRLTDRMKQENRFSPTS